MLAGLEKRGDLGGRQGGSVERNFVDQAIEKRGLNLIAAYRRVVAMMTRDPLPDAGCETPVRTPITATITGSKVTGDFTGPTVCLEATKGTFKGDRKP